MLLLDDVFSELDESRQQKLIERLSGHQTVVTCTHIDGAMKRQFKDAALYRVENGSVALL